MINLIMLEYRGRPMQKCIALDMGIATLGAGLVSGIGSLIGGSSSGKNNLRAVRETNAANQAIANAYNQNQIKLAQMQNQWNIEQRDYMNAYNDPSSQMKRFQAAGINPYMAVGQISGGNQESALESATPQTQAPPQLQAPNYDYQQNMWNNFASNINQLMSAYNMAEQAKGHGIDNRFNAMSVGMKFAKMQQEYENSIKKGTYQDLINENQRQVNAKQVEFQDLSIQTANAQIRLYNAQSLLAQSNEVLNRATARCTDAQTRNLDLLADQIVQTTFKIQAETKLTLQQCYTEACKRHALEAAARKNNAEAKELEDGLSYRIGALCAQMDVAQEQADYAAQTHNERVYKVYLDNKKNGKYDYKSGFGIGTPWGNIGPSVEYTGNYYDVNDPNRIITPYTPKSRRLPQHHYK